MDDLKDFLDQDDPSLFGEDEVIDPADHAAEVERQLQQVRNGLAEIAADRPGDLDFDQDSPVFVDLGLAYNRLNELQSLAAEVHRVFMGVSSG